MPRLVRTTRLKQKTKYRVELASRQRVRSDKWVDPFPSVHGTLPEKMVYAELSRRKIPFYFLNDVRLSFPEIDLIKEFQADFIIPSLNIIIEVQGAYWHSKPKTIESDSIKMAYYEMAGYRVIAWYDYDIQYRIHELFAMDPQLTSASNIGAVGIQNHELPPMKRTKVDTSKGIVTMNRKRGIAQAYKRQAVRTKIKRR